MVRNLHGTSLSARPMQRLPILQALTRTARNLRSRDVAYSSTAHMTLASILRNPMAKYSYRSGRCALMKFPIRYVMCSRLALASMCRLRRRHMFSQWNTSPVQFGQAPSISPTTVLRFVHFLELETRLIAVKPPGCWETARPNTSRFSSHLCSILRLANNPLRAKRLRDASFIHRRTTAPSPYQLEPDQRRSGLFE